MNKTKETLLTAADEYDTRAGSPQHRSHFEKPL